ncbi:unnamed protein product [Cyprideis torosa]|uniref:hydroxymethylbilane synthase n=1 Tax=Cyprideis torosa TaxID=163714 RepID=A0A7R8ZIW3_9CRUS|nr:unnamed protein product [Cyprideis torosa]CAG0887154.1 unnamed protein product [Cyprideis torosa]
MTPGSDREVGVGARGTTSGVDDTYTGHDPRGYPLFIFTRDRAGLATHMIMNVEYRTGSFLVSDKAIYSMQLMKSYKGYELGALQVVVGLLMVQLASWPKSSFKVSFARNSGFTMGTPDGPPNGPADGPAKLPSAAGPVVLSSTPPPSREPSAMNDLWDEPLRVGTRKSELAKIQTAWVITRLKDAFPELLFEVVEISTLGDHRTDVPLSQVGQRGLFTKELDIALANNEVDIIVHSLKDVPTVLPDRMLLGAVCEREDPCDAVIVSKSLKNMEFRSLDSLPAGSVIGTSSLRRLAQLKTKYPNLVVQDIRGNLNTRLRKLDEGNYDALILAACGVTRMNWSHRISELLSPSEFLYAVGQGSLGVQISEESASKLLPLLHPLCHPPSVVRAVLERSFLKRLEGGCSVPIGVASEATLPSAKEPWTLSLTGGVFTLEGDQSVVMSVQKRFSDPISTLSETSSSKAFSGIALSQLNPVILEKAEEMGVNLADAVIQQGGGKILDHVRSTK